MTPSTWARCPSGPADTARPKAGLAPSSVSPHAVRQPVTRNRIPWLFFEPFFEDIHRLIDLAQCAVRQRQQLSRFAVLRSERDHFAVARRGFFGALQPVEQNAQVGIRVDMF